VRLRRARVASLVRCYYLAEIRQVRAATGRMCARAGYGRSLAGLARQIDGHWGKKDFKKDFKMILVAMGERAGAGAGRRDEATASRAEPSR
jgi:hypothetical protein